MCLHDKHLMIGLHTFPHKIVVRNILIIFSLFKPCFPTGRRKPGLCFLLIKSDTDIHVYLPEQQELNHRHITIIRYDMVHCSEAWDGYDSSCLPKKA